MWWNRRAKVSASTNALSSTGGVKHRLHSMNEPLIYMPLFLVRDAAVHDRGRRVRVPHPAVLAAARLNAADHLHRLRVLDLAEHDVLAVQPASDDSGDEELRAVAVKYMSTSHQDMRLRHQWGKHKEKCLLTCWAQHWPWRADRARCGGS